MKNYQKIEQYSYFLKRLIPRIWLVLAAFGLLSMAACSSLRANRLKNKSYKQWSKDQKHSDSTQQTKLLH